MKRLTTIFVISALAIVTLTSCTSLDVVGTDSVRAFGEVLNALPAKPDISDSDSGWTFSADGSATLGISPGMLVVYIDPAPFIAAGLDVTALTPLPNQSVSSLGISFYTPGYDMLNENPPETPLAAFENSIKANRSAVGYHTALDHYNIDFGGGNMFEWAKDISTNDKDVVFVLNPEPLIAAGVDPNAVEGWSYAAVPVEIDGKATDVFKFLKPFDLN
jgi:hypothetical protein